MTQAFPGTEDTRSVSEVDAHVKGADRDALLALNAELLAALDDLCANVIEAMRTGGWVPTPLHGSFWDAVSDAKAASAKARGEQ